MASSYNFVQETLVFYLNGERRELTGAEVDPRRTLADYVRSQGLTGTKLGCGEGGCGACTVMVSHWDPDKKKVIHQSVAGCLLPLPYVDHMAVTTVEGVAKTLLGSTIQENIAKKHGTQCGYCTPGFVMSIYSTAMKNPKATVSDVEECLDGNLCRCTGYRSILEAAHAIASDYDPSKDGKLSQEANKSICARKAVEAAEPDLPEELKQPLRALRLSGPAGAWFRPVSLDELLDVKSSLPEAVVLGGRHSFPGKPGTEGAGSNPKHPLAGAQVVSGNTEIGYHERYHPSAPGSFSAFVSTAAVRELHSVEVTDAGTRVGVAMTLNGLSDLLKQRPCEGQAAVCSILRVFANNQVRDMGTLGGSIVTADPLSDLYPALVCLGSTVRLVSRRGGQRDMPLDEFVTGENTTALRQDEVVLSVFIPHTRAHEFAQTFKESKRRLDAQSAVNAGLRVLLSEREGEGDDEEHAPKVLECCVCFGALGPRAALRFPKTEQALLGHRWTERTVLAAIAVLREELLAAVVRSRGQAEYRMTVACSLLYRFYAQVRCRAGADLWPTPAPADVRSALPGPPHVVHTGSQSYQDPEPGAAVGRPVPHAAAELHANGKAVFVGDLTEPSGCLHAAYAQTKRAHAKLVRVDATEALRCPGVVGVYTAADIPAQKLLGITRLDEEFLASDEIVYYGEPGAVVAARSRREARAAAALVKFEYEDLPTTLTIEEAIEKKSWLEEEHEWKELRRGQPEEVLARAAKGEPEPTRAGEVLRFFESEVRVLGQEHFYIEPQAALVTPGDTYDVRVTSQNPTRMQRVVAGVLGLPMSRVESRMERIGGGFGGKQDRPQFLAAACALAAHKTGHAVRFVLERDEDMQVTGQRHEFLARYKAAYSPRDGRLVAADVTLYANGGCSLDLTPSVVEVCMFALDNCYCIENMHIRGVPCRTNKVSCTAYRGFGKPQAMVIMESIMDQVARSAGMRPAVVRDVNLLHQGNAILDGTVVEPQFFECWDPLHKLLEQKEKEAAEFNAHNKWRKLGVALVPSRNNIGFEADCLNQAGALVHVYTDGSVFVTHGGSEMGQGLHTKLSQIAADALGCPLERVHVSATSTDRVPNTSATAASSGSDLNGTAVLNAATEIRKRLDELRARQPDGGKALDWEHLVTLAYLERVQLSATGYHSFEKYTYRWAEHKGRSSLYNIWGAALAVVEFDVLTGQWRSRSVDIRQDVGHSLNPALDVGQIEGGLAQGIGLFTIEELLWARDGHMRTRNVSTYKIPTHDDIPEHINIALIENSASKEGVRGNKSPSEVGVQLAGSVLMALKDAVYAARMQLLAEQQAPAPGAFFRLDTPATVEKVRLACPTVFNVAAPARK